MVCSCSAQRSHIRWISVKSRRAPNVIFYFVHMTSTTWSGLSGFMKYHVLLLLNPTAVTMSLGRLNHRCMKNKIHTFKFADGLPAILKLIKHSVMNSSCAVEVWTISGFFFLVFIRQTIERKNVQPSCNENHVFFPLLQYELKQPT